jgi:copper transport protein
VLQETPAGIRLRFNEPVSPLVVSLTDSQGRMHHGLAVAPHGDTLDIAMPGELPRGSHILSYRVTSGDGHPVGGSLVFSIGAPTRMASGAGGEESAGVRAALWLARIALYLGLFAGAGGAFFSAWVAQDLPFKKTARLLETFIAMGTVAALASLGLQGLDALGQPLSALGRSAAWMAGWQTSYGSTVAVGLAALLLAGISLKAPRKWRRGCSLAALIGVGLSLALSGHASAAAPQWATRPAVFFHVVGVAYWVGALLPLVLAVKQAPAQAFPVVRRFSIGALVAVAVLTLAGLVLALIQVETPANLTETAYGRVLIAKLVLVLGLLGLAALNRRWLTPALISSGRFGSKWLVRSIAAEILLATAILALVGLWRFTPPPRALSTVADAAAPASVHLHTPHLMAQVTLLPGRAGATRARIAIASGRAEPLDPKEVTLILAKPDAGIEALERPARKAGRYGWQVDGLVLPLPGPWQVKVEILVNDFETSRLEGSITVKP